MPTSDPLPSFPPLARAVERWRSADHAFRIAGSRAERGAAMHRQLEARRAVHQISEIELSIPHALRAMLVAEGIWSAAEALDRLVAVDFAARACALAVLAPALSGADLDRALEMASRPGWGDDARWERDEALIEALTARVARAGDSHGGTVEVATPPTPARVECGETLAAILDACRASGKEEWLAPSFAAAVDYVASDLQPEHAVELARDRARPGFVELRGALLARGHDLWDKPWFSAVFDVEERRAHLRHVLDRRERAPGTRSDRFEGLLDVAERLHGAARAEVLGWASVVRKAGASLGLTDDLARIAALAAGAQPSEPAPEAGARTDAALEPELARIWIAHASASAYRHALALFEDRFCEHMLAGSDQHPRVLQLVQTLGDDAALLGWGRTLAAPDVT